MTAVPNSLNYVLPTALDLLNAILYANSRLKKEKCEELARTGFKVKKETTPPSEVLISDIHWRDDTKGGKETSYYCPPGLTGGCDHGHCVFGRTGCGQVSNIFFGSKKKETTTPKGGETGTSPGTNDSFPYTEWRDNPTPTASKQPVKPSSEPEGKCILGDYPFMNWCSKPKSRNTGNVPGVTDVTPFAYDNSTGRCHVTKGYCDGMGMNCDTLDNPPKVCSGSGSGSGTDNGCCSGCSVSGTQRFFEDFVVGRTLFRTYKRISDRLLKDNISLIGRDFAGTGINLYVYTYKPVVYKTHPDYPATNVGFMTDEVKRYLPELVVSGEGPEYITVTSSDALKDPRKKRIFGVFLMHDKIVGMLRDTVSRLQK